MPTKKTNGPRGSARLNLAQFLMLSDLNWASVERGILRWREKLWMGGLTPDQALLRLFDPKLTDLSLLPVGILTLKPLTLPPSLIPASEPELLRFCRRLIHRGEDAAYIDLMLAGWPGGATLEAHVSDIWKLRTVNPLVHRLIVQGEMGHALVVLHGSETEGEFSAGDLRAMIVRQELLWSANDVQVTTARARVSFQRPMGPLLSGTMRVFKVPTVLRLMREALDLLKQIVPLFQSQDEIDRLGPNGAKPKGMPAKVIAHQAEREIETGEKDIATYQRELEDSVPAIAAKIPDLEQQQAALEDYASAAARGEEARGEARPATNLMHFHPMWYSGLSPVAGVMVACMRMAMAESRVADMVECAAASIMNADPETRRTEPLPALPTDIAEQKIILNRAFDLTSAARRSLLRDPDWKSRSRPSQSDIAAAVAAEGSLTDRDPVDKIGPFAATALRFLRTMGRRKNSAHFQPNADGRALTYYHMDVTPEQRLWSLW